MSSSFRWFHINLNGQDAERLLKENGLAGSFLVRPSTTTGGDFTLSVLRKSDQVTHIRIHNSGDFYDLFGGEKFASLKELVQYYTENETLQEKSGDTIKLTFPVNSVDPTPERWFHGSINGGDAEKYLLDNSRSKTGSFLVRESKSTPGNYVLSVRTEDRVTHVKIRLKDGKYDLGGGSRFESLSDLIEYYRKSPMVEMNGQVIHLKAPFNATRINASCIKSRVEELSKESRVDKDHKPGFWEEFEQLAGGDSKDSPHRLEGAKPENKPKNRFKNILPFDHTRVVLKDGSSKVPGSDYINANYIKDDEPDGAHVRCKSYIATQGCLPSTIDDFWRMIAQEHTRVVVMVTKEVERGKNKCAMYWPLQDEPRVVETRTGRITVSFVSEKDTSDWKQRTLKLKYEVKHDFQEKCEEWQVYQYHFLKWPDHGVPSDPGAILQLLDAVNHRQEEDNSGPIAVHCSAGIGRTGTFIAIDILINQIRRRGLSSEIDIQKTITSLRSQRSGMVQAEAQYKFVYLAVQHYIDTETARDTERRRITGGNEYTNINCDDSSVAAKKAPSRPTSTSEVATELSAVPLGT